MSGKWWRWPLYLFLAWQLIRIVWGALSAPWAWTMDQWLLVYLALCLPVGLVVWGRIWKRGGMEAVKDRWHQVLHVTDTPRGKMLYRRWYWFWMVVAIGIVIFLTLTQHNHV